MSARTTIHLLADRPVTTGGIWPLLHATPGTLVAIAPETATRLTAPVSEVRFRLLDSHIAVAEATRDEDGGIITISSGMAEAIWGCAYANVVLGREATEGARRMDGQTALTMPAGPGTPVRVGLDLLDAALQLAIFSTPIDWTGRPTPVAPDEIDGTSILVAQAGEMTLAALAYILHHELAHLSLEHEGCGMLDSQWTLDEEREADNFAIEWIMDEAPERATSVGKRAWGMVIALSFLTTLELVETVRLHHSPSKRRTHPHSHIRLDNAVKHGRVQDDPLARETIHQLACAALLVPLRDLDLPLGDGPFEDFPACYEAMMDVVANAVVA